MIIDDFDKGQRLTAEWVNQITRIVRALKFTGAGGIAVTQNSGGWNISFQGDLNNVAIVKFQTTEEVEEYPALGDDCNIFPAKLYPRITVDDANCMNGVTLGTPGTEVNVASLWETYIPEDMVALAWRVNGYWYTEATIARHITFALPATLAAEDITIADCPVVAYRWGGDPGETVTLINELGFFGSVDMQGYAEYDNIGRRYIIYQLAC